jgi:cell shape-determining protein MreC
VPNQATSSVSSLDDLATQFKRFHQRITSLERASTSGAGGPTPPPTVVNYVHNQSTASAVWTITHNLGWYPNVTVIDSAGTNVEGDVTQVNNNTMRINFSGAFTGIAYLS